VDPSRTLPQVPLEIEEDLILEVKQVKVLNQIEKELKNKKIYMIKVLWRSFKIEEKTWKRELETRNKYPKLFLDSGTRIKFREKNFI